MSKLGFAEEKAPEAGQQAGEQAQNLAKSMNNWLRTNEGKAAVRSIAKEHSGKFREAGIRRLLSTLGENYTREESIKEANTILGRMEGAGELEKAIKRLKAAPEKLKPVSVSATARVAPSVSGARSVSAEEKVQQSISGGAASVSAEARIKKQKEAE